MNSKICSRCGNELVGRQTKWCSAECQSLAAREKRLGEHFSITAEEYDAILAFQGGACAVCKRPPKDGKRLAVDHDHQTGYVRGLLCFYDNKRVLGARTASAIVALAAYVTDPPARHVVGDRVAAGRPRKQRRSRKRVKR